MYCLKDGVLESDFEVICNTHYFSK